MRHLLSAVLCVVALAGTTSLSAATYSDTWCVATVHGTNEFAIGEGGTSLLYHQQGWTDYKWNQNNGSPDGTIAQGMYGDRTGMRTFATTDVAVGQKLSDLKLVFEYHNTLGGYPTMNFFMTDGNGKFGIFSPASSGINAVATQDILNGWTRMTLDLTNPNISDTATVAVYEHNGFVNEYGDPFTSMTWGDIKNLTIAGMYDYQRSPSGGWEAWGSMFSPMNTAGSSTIVNGHGLALIWGDTVNSNNTYGSKQCEIRNVVVSFGGDDYAGSFQSCQVPEPTTLLIWSVLAVLGAVAYGRRK